MSRVPRFSLVESSVNHPRWVVFLLVGAVLGMPLASQAGQGEAQARTSPSVGDKAPDSTSKDFQGKRFTLAELRGREGALLWFTNLCEGWR